MVDDDQARIVVLRPDATHKRNTGNMAATREARRFLENRGNAQRLYKNMLVFLAADDNDAQALVEAVRESLAWTSIQKEADELNLDRQQTRQVTTSCEKANETVDLRLRAAYNWLLVPVQPDPLGHIELQAFRISGDDNFYERAARKLRNDGLLIYQWSPDILRMELDRYIWNDERGWEVQLKQLWEYLAQYCYLPRLSDSQVLIKAVQDGIGRLDAPFAYATGKNEKGEHTGIVFRSLGNVYFDNDSLIVHPDHLQEPPEVIKPLPTDDTEKPHPPEPEKPTEPAKKQFTRYYGRVKIDPQRVNKEMGVIVEEVIERLTSQLGCEVEISLEVQADKPDGFEEGTVRTVNENSRTLKFDDFGFEEK